MKCYTVNVEVNEYRASLPLRDLFNHTTKRLLEIINYFDTKDFEDFIYFDLHFKWRCDRSSEHSEYHHKYDSRSVNANEQQIDVESNREFDMENMDVDETNTTGGFDANSFLFSLVPLKLIGTKNNDLVSNVWENPKPSSSTRYCRPLRLFIIFNRYFFLNLFLYLTIELLALIQRHGDVCTDIFLDESKICTCIL